MNLFVGIRQVPTRLWRALRVRYGSTRHRLDRTQEMDDMKLDKPYYPLAEASTLLGVGTRTLRSAIERGQIGGEKIGGRWFVFGDEIDRRLLHRAPVDRGSVEMFVLRSSPIKRECKHCGAEFVCGPSALSRARKRYCSAECVERAKREREREIRDDARKWRELEANKNGLDRGF